jgi:alpha-glucosidase
VRLVVVRGLGKIPLMTAPGWWTDAVIYQIYPRSFQDSNGDGVGDLEGIRRRLDHLVELGVDGLWLSPIYPSPLADFGYDVSDYTAVDAGFGSLEGFDQLLDAAHDRGLRVLMDLVPCHTSIEHPWFSEHPDWYIWADGRDGGPPNNWMAAFGGSAWTFHPERGRYYLHSFYPEQPDLDWRNPEVVAAMQEVVRFWIERGADGYRIDAIDRIMKDPELRDDPPASEPFGLPLRADEARYSLVHSRNGPGTEKALAAMREAAGDDALLIGEVYLPARSWAPYLETFDGIFAFELFHSPFEAEPLREAIEAAVAARGPRPGGAAWVVSNHDFPRMPNRFGSANLRTAAMLLLTLPGMAFLYQGDEIGMHDGPGAQPPFDRAGRDGHRHPMQWDGSPSGGFTTGTPWLAPLDPAERSVERQSSDPDSLLALWRKLIELRRSLAGELELLDAAQGVVAYARGDHTVALNTTAEARPAPLTGTPVLETTRGALAGGRLAPSSGAIVRG